MRGSPRGHRGAFQRLPAAPPARVLERGDPGGGVPGEGLPSPPPSPASVWHCPLCLLTCEEVCAASQVSTEHLEEEEEGGGGGDPAQRPC